MKKFCALVVAILLVFASTLNVYAFYCPFCNESCYLQCSGTPSGSAYLITCTISCHTDCNATAYNYGTFWECYFHGYIQDYVDHQHSQYHSFDHSIYNVCPY